MNFENMSKEQLIELLTKNHTHTFENQIDSVNRKWKKICPCGYVEEFDLSLIENPNHKHEFKYTVMKTKFDDDEKTYSVKLAECKTCSDKRIYIMNSIELNENAISAIEMSPKCIPKDKKTEKTQMYYPKTEMSIINFNGPNKQTYSGKTEQVFYIKSTDKKWYKATQEIGKYIVEHFMDWTESTKILFKVDASKHVVPVVVSGCGVSSGDNGCEVNNVKHKNKNNNNEKLELLIDDE